MALDKKRPSRLGRGLSSLMNQPVAVQPPKPESGPDSGHDSKTDFGSAAGASSGPQHEVLADVPRETSEAARALRGDLASIPVDQISANPHQPRQDFDEAGLASLAESIREQGVMQPVLLRKSETGGYLLVAGERRWRAAQRAGLAAIPALIRQLDDQQSAELAIIENIQREDLNPIERAEAFQRLSDSFGLTHEQVAERVGVDRSSVTNLLRLLKLGSVARQYLRDGLLSMGQARALAGVQDTSAQAGLSERAVRENLSVRKVEALAKQANTGTVLNASQPKASAKSSNLLDLERQITEQIGSRVLIKPGKKKNSGTLTIQYTSADEFEALCERMNIRFEN